MNRDFKVIAAIGMNTGIIGCSKSNDMLWKIPTDLQFFKTVTLGNTIVMGSRTYDSINNKNLPERRSVVLTRNPGNLKGSPHAVYSSFEDALKYEDPNMFVIGGGKIYQECLKFNPKRIYLTIVDDSEIRPNGLTESDVAFPITGIDVIYRKDSPMKIHDSMYDVTFEGPWESENGFTYKFVELTNTLY